jgi:dihydrofolate reductase
VEISVFIATTLDGYIARTDGSFDFLEPYEGDPHGYDEFMATVDALLVGRKTYETVLAFPGWPFAKPVFVLSTQPLTPAPPGAVVEAMSGEPGTIEANLEQRGFQHIYLDGGVTIQRFLRAGLVDRMIISRAPVLIGGGVPLFGPIENQTTVRHIATRSYPSGLIQSEYRQA